MSTGCHFKFKGRVKVKFEGQILKSNSINIKLLTFTGVEDFKIFVDVSARIPKYVVRSLNIT